MLARSLTLVLPLVAAGAVSAQQSYVIPAGFGYDTNPGEFAMTAGFSGNPFVSGNYSHAQVVFDSSTLPFSMGMVSKVQARRDAQSGQNFPSVARTFTMRLGYTSVTPTHLPFRFSQVSSPQLTVVLNAPVSLPAETYLGKVAHPWSVDLNLSAPWPFDATRGNLVVDIESDGTNSTEWAVDSHFTYWDGQPATENVLFGGCVGSNGKPFLVIRDPYQVATGRTMQLIARNIPLTVGGATMILGFPLSMPVTIPGTNGCQVVLQGVCDSHQPGFNEGSGSLCAENEVPIPNVPLLIGQQFAWQWGYVDPAANPTGVVSSEAGTFTVGTGPSVPYHVQTNTAYFAGLDIARQSGAELAPILRVTGTLQ